MTYSEVLRIRPFRNLWLGQAVSTIGDALYYVAFMFMVKKITGSSAMVGYTGALEAIPYLLLGPYAGVIADRMDRRRIMLASDLFSAAALLSFGLILIANLTPPAWAILLLAFVLSSIRCFFMPAKSAAVPALVPAESLMTANSLSSATQTFMPVIGLAISATVLAALYAISARWFFFMTIAVNALSFVISALFIALLPAIHPKRSDAHERHPIADFREGIRYVWKRHELRVLIFLISIFRFTMAPFFVAFVVANDLWWGGRTHHGSPKTLAIVELTFCMGMVIASLSMSRVRARHPAQWFCWGLLVVGVTVCLMAVSPQIWLFCVWNFIAGLGLPTADIPINTYIQLSVEDAFRGRTSSALNMIASIAAPVGMALGGMFVTGFGLPATFFGMGFGMTAACLGGLGDRKLRTALMPGEA